MSLSLQLLGQQVVTIDGAVAAPLAPLQRRLLALLASHPDQPLGREWLAVALWGESGGAQLRALQVHISHLRGALGKDCIDSVEYGYRLVIEPDAIDETRFRVLIHEGKEAVARGDYDDAITLLGEALEMWGGEPYLDITTDEFLARRAGLRELRLSAEDALLRARVELIRQVSDAESAIPLSTQMYADQPTRESRVIMHMRCLMVAGRLTDAANVAADHRRRVLQEVGVEPGPEFTETATRVLRRDTGLMPASWRSRVDVPSYFLPLLQRDHQHELVVSLLKWDSVRLMCLTGEHGVGKTRLAASVAETLGHGLPGGVIWLTGESARDPDDLLAKVADAAGVRGNSAEVRQRIPMVLGRRRTLVVLDGVEGAAVMSAVAILLAAGPLLSILVTGSERLGLASEHEMRLHPLSLADAESFVIELLEALSGQGGAEEHAGLPQTGWRNGGSCGLDAVGDKSEFGDSLMACGGLPLALEQMAISMLSEMSRA